MNMNDNERSLLAENERLREERNHNELRGLEYKAKCEVLLAALRHIRSAGGACPCGAWFGDEDKRPHVIGCPVGAAISEVEGEKT